MTSGREWREKADMRGSQCERPYFLALAARTISTVAPNYCIKLGDLGKENYSDEELDFSLSYFELKLMSNMVMAVLF